VFIPIPCRNTSFLLLPKFLFAKTIRTISLIENTLPQLWLKCGTKLQCTETVLSRCFKTIPRPKTMSISYVMLYRYCTKLNIAQTQHTREIQFHLFKGQENSNLYLGNFSKNFTSFHRYKNFRWIAKTYFSSPLRRVSLIDTTSFRFTTTILKPWHTSFVSN